MGPDANFREFAAFLMSNKERQVMISNRLSIHVETGHIFYENHNTGENFYNFLVAQQNGEAALIPKIFAYRNKFEMYISQFLQTFSLGDIEKYDLFAHKNSKYLFYRFNEYVKAYGGSRKKIRHTRKYENSIGKQNLEQKCKQFLVKKIIDGIEFKNPYNVDVEKSPKLLRLLNIITR